MNHITPLDETYLWVRALGDIASRYTAFNFMFPAEKPPLFNNDREEVSRHAANQTADLFHNLISRPGKPVPRDQAQRFVLQLVVAMFAEDIDLLPSGTVTGIIQECLNNKQSAYDLFGGLFNQMNTKKPATGGRFVGVPYFNGGLFSVVDPIELNRIELNIVGGEQGIAGRNWSKVNPAIFGTIFQHSMNSKERHQHGRHFTSESDIQRIVGPTIVQPWQQRIDAASKPSDLIKLRKELSEYRVLDPACGSGNFLYVAYREMARLDNRILLRLLDMKRFDDFHKQAANINVIRPKQFFGIDNDPFGVELTKVVLLLAKKLAIDESIAALNEGEGEFTKGTLEFRFAEEEVLPLDNLDGNILLGDALFLEWPKSNAIIGNPPYQSKNKLQEELGPAYLNALRARHSEVDGRADYCVYWFRLAHDHLGQGERAGLVGTNTIKQNYSREAGLDYIVANGGTITEAVSSMIWPGAANLSVSIVNWTKGEMPGPKRLYVQEGHVLEAGWRHTDLDRIGASLSFSLDVTKAKSIKANSKRGGCFQGQTHGHAGFLLKPDVAKGWIGKDAKNAQVLKPFLIAEDLIGEIDSRPTRYVIDFSGMDLLEAQEYGEPFARVQSLVLPARQKAAQKEAERNKEVLTTNPDARVNRHHENFLKKWWKMSYPREDMKKSIRSLDRYISCGCVTLRPIFDFVSTEINPNAALQVFPYDDDYSFGILQSSIHWQWFVNRCSTLTERFRYTSNTVFDSFPWPQRPTLSAIKKVAAAAVELRQIRRDLQKKHGVSLRDLYRSVELPGDHPLKGAIENLDSAVRAAYGMPKATDPLEFLLKLNAEVALAEQEGKAVQGPGLPAAVTDRKALVSRDCVRAR